MVLNRLQQHIGRRFFIQHHRRAVSKREQQQAAKSEGEAQWRCAAKNVVWHGFENGAREGVTDRQDVAMEMHRSLGRAGRAGAEGDDADIVCGSIDIGKGIRLAGYSDAEPLAIGRGMNKFNVSQRRALSGGFMHHIREQFVAQGMADRRLIDDLGEFLCAQQRHRRDAYGTGFLDRKPAGCHHRMVVAV